MKPWNPREPVPLSRKAEPLGLPGISLLHD
jgi:hypothetical protein